MTTPATIQEGATGATVRWLQYLLVRRTLSFTDIDGVFDPHTATAVKGAQHEAGITADGIVGLQTWALPVHAAGEVIADLCGVPGPGGS
jgi:peptidoglycan hydrolase-like protein with peptidoglycan-binding domain